MSLLKRTEKPRPLRTASRGAAGAGVSALRPRQAEKRAPCAARCPAGNDVRGWLATIAQREKLGITADEALDRAFAQLAATNPMPAALGRVCPHPCEGGCNRGEKDGAVAVHTLERFVGDRAIERGLPLPRLAPPGSRPEKVAVVGAGPAGLSCAYQLARRGYAVTVLERLPEAGGMLRYGIPDYRLPRAVLDAEVRRIAAVGVELRCGTSVGADVPFERLQEEHDAVFVGIGAHQGRKLRVPGEDGPGVLTGTGFLREVAAGAPPPLGRRVAVIGGGDTAVDAARVSRRLGAEVTLVYRRTRAEMPAIAEEVEGAVEEEVALELLAAPARIERDGSGRVVKLVLERMRLGEPDASGRRAPVATGEQLELACDTVIAAVSQEPELAALGGQFAGLEWLEADRWGRTFVPRVWTGGDDLRAALATTAIGQGRAAAEAIDAALRGEKPAEPADAAPVTAAKMKLDLYPPATRVAAGHLGAAVRLADPHGEIVLGVTPEQSLGEAARCLSCGSCFGCERCWMYCTPACFTKSKSPAPGSHYQAKLETCDGCRKCADECPCGFLEMQ